MILLIDDDVQLRMVLARALGKSGYDVREAENGQQALERISEKMPRLVITDLVMPDRDGLELIKEMGSRYPELPVIAMSGNAGSAKGDLLKVALRMGACATLPKPFSIQEITDLVAQVLGDATSVG